MMASVLAEIHTARAHCVWQDDIEAKMQAKTVRHQVDKCRPAESLKR
jgi:hypothetical protein